MLDFNEVEEPFAPAVNLDNQRDEIRAALLARLESVLFTLFPAGKVRRGKFHIGDILGSPGDSLEIVLGGEKAGLWTDRESGEGGDVFAIVAGHHGINVRSDFARVLEIAADLSGRASAIPARSPRKAKQEAATDDLGKATAKWDYQDAGGNLIAVVYRYDPPGRRKEFRPWDAKRRKMAPPDPRPLYNQPGIAKSDQVVLVEGEKCAQALIDAGHCATTAMHGANAPVDKTDWSPLAGKAVIIWPDKDKPGWTYAENAAQAILAAKATSCVILYPPEGKPDGWDCADALAEGVDVHDIVANSPYMTIHLPDIASVNVGEKTFDGEKGDQEPTVWGSDDSLALSFTKRYQNDWRYVAAWGKWLIWDGQRWRNEDTLAASDLVRHVCRFASLKSKNPKLAAKLAASSTIGGVERLARSDRRHAGTTDEWDADMWALNTPRGVVDLHTGRMRAHQRSDRMTKIATATPRGQCPTWLRFLSDITNGDQELVDYLQVMVGYCLTGVTSEHALFFLYGTGANGKSVFVNVLSTILGDYAANAPMDTFMETRGDRHPTDLAGLRGARFVSSIETEQGRSWNESKVKAITGGDKVSARFMRQDFFEYFPQFKLIIAGNHKPSIRNVDEAMKRRLHLIPFTVTIAPAKRDGQLTEKLLMERDAIMAWAVEGCKRWQANGLKPPTCVVAATDEYFDEEDAIGEFIAAEAQICAPAKVSVADVFARWQEWSSKRGEYVGTSRWLAQQLANRGFARCRIHGGVKALSGLSLRPKDYGNSLPYADN
jgi:putative DNA primase/helicase